MNNAIEMQATRVSYFLVPYNLYTNCDMLMYPLI